MELFAGKADLSKAVSARGLPTVVPEDLARGGVNFQVDDEVAVLQRRCRHLLDLGFKILTHMAPPCSSFSRARDRSSRTRVRSAGHPEGFCESEAVDLGNDVADRAYRLALWAKEQRCSVTIENQQAPICGPTWMDYTERWGRRSLC